MGSKEFALDHAFVRKYEKEDPNFGFNGLGDTVYRRSYSRLKANGEKERWFETVERVVNGTFNMQLRWARETHIPWDHQQSIKLAEDMYHRIFTMKFLPPGRGLWAMGSSLTEEKHLYASLNNCAFVSTENIASNPTEPFLFLMDASMLGIGVGFDTRGAGTITIKGTSSQSPYTHAILDSREGWVKSLDLLLQSYFCNRDPVEFDYSLIRAAGEPIRGFGGFSAGPKCLEDMHRDIRNLLERSTGNPISVTTIVDIMNLIGRCVVAGNLRRSAEISFGNPDDEEYIQLKNYERNPHRANFGWASNNSVFATIGMDYSRVCELSSSNGEPGFAWLENMRKYDRMNGIVTNKDYRAMGGNPCLEQTLESHEMCCLVETFPTKHDTIEDYINTLQSALLYAKTVTLGRTHWAKTNQVIHRNRRIGTSMSGIAQFIACKGQETLREWCEKGYDALKECDRELSDKFGVRESIKLTSIKPSGTVSLLAGATAGLHYPISRYYLRRVRLAADSDMIKALKNAGYPMEPAIGSEETTVIVSFPVDAGIGLRKVKEVSMWEQLGLAAFLQRHWADNQVSCTVTFNPETEGAQMKHALNLYQYQLKGISFLPHSEGVYAQMPYEEISKETFLSLTSSIKPIQWTTSTAHDPQADNFCDGDHCVL